MKKKWTVVLDGYDREEFTYDTRKEADRGYERLRKAADKQTKLDGFPRQICFQVEDK